MLIVKLDNKQPLEKALKILKKKWDSTKTLRELRERREFIPKSHKKRISKIKAKYIQNKYRSED